MEARPRVRSKPSVSVLCTHIVVLAALVRTWPEPGGAVMVLANCQKADSSEPPASPWSPLGPGAPSAPGGPGGPCGPVPVVTETPGLGGRPTPTPSAAGRVTPTAGAT